MSRRAGGESPRYRAPRTCFLTLNGDSLAMHSLAMYQLVALSDEAAHQVPAIPFTADQAHTVMRYHVACRAKRCPRKAAALQALAAAGRLVPSTRHPR